MLKRDTIHDGCVQRFGRKSSTVAQNADERTWIRDEMIYVQRTKRAGMSKVLDGAVDGRIEGETGGGTRT